MLAGIRKPVNISIKKEGIPIPSQTVDKPEICFFCGVQPHFVFSPTGAAEKHLISEKTLYKRFFKGTGVVLVGIECSPEIFDFRANGIPDQERVGFSARSEGISHTLFVAREIKKTDRVFKSFKTSGEPPPAILIACVSRLAYKLKYILYDLFPAGIVVYFVAAAFVKL